MQAECIANPKNTALPNIIFFPNIAMKNGLVCLKFAKENKRFSEIAVVIYSKSHV